jgi:hypothetical protein
VLTRDSYQIMLSPPGGGAQVQKQVNLKLIVAPGIPSQFLTPWEQGLNDQQVFNHAGPLSAVIMWDPNSVFSFFAPRTAADAQLPDADAGRRGTLETMDAWVAFAHEVGHFEDFLLDADAFRGRLRAGDIGAIEGWNLPREQAIVRDDLGKTPRVYYQDFVGGLNDAKLRLP